MNGEVVFYELAVAVCMGLAALGFFVWSVLSGQFEDTEDVKHRILMRELDDEGKRADG